MLYDTSFLIDSQREQKRNEIGPAKKFLESHGEGELLTSIICAVEFATGFDATTYDKFIEQMDPFRVLPMDATIAWRAGQLRRRLKQRGRPIGDHDTLIAATALHHVIPLVTRNTRQFEAVEGLIVLSY